MAAATPSLEAQVATLTTQVGNFQNELDAFYLMWAGELLPLWRHCSRTTGEAHGADTRSSRAAQVR